MVPKPCVIKAKGRLTTAKRSSITGNEASDPAERMYRCRMATILLIEDEQRIRQRLADRLTELGHAVDTAARGIAGVEATVAGTPDIVVLDLGLPDLDGSEVLRMIRAVSQVPIVIATAQNEERQIVQLLDLGADDYLVKPFGAEQLEARIRAVLRRRGVGDESNVVTVGGLVIDLDAQTAVLNGDEIELTAKEFDLLAYLAERSGKMISKRELMAEVWKQPYGGADKTVDVHLSWLRRKLGEKASDPRYIQTKRGAGVRLVDPTS